MTLICYMTLSNSISCSEINILSLIQSVNDQWMIAYCVQHSKSVPTYTFHILFPYIYPHVSFTLFTRKLKLRKVIIFLGLYVASSPKDRSFLLKSRPAKHKASSSLPRKEGRWGASHSRTKTGSPQQGVGYLLQLTWDSVFLRIWSLKIHFLFGLFPLSTYVPWS